MSERGKRVCHSDIHTCMHTDMHTYMHACINTYIHTYICWDRDIRRERDCDKGKGVCHTDTCTHT